MRPRMAPVIAAGLLAIGVAGPACGIRYWSLPGPGLPEVRSVATSPRLGHSRPTRQSRSSRWTPSTRPGMAPCASATQRERARQRDGHQQRSAGRISHSVLLAGDIPGLSCARDDLLHRPGHQRQFDACGRRSCRADDRRRDHIRWRCCRQRPGRDPDWRRCWRIL